MSVVLWLLFALMSALLVLVAATLLLQGRRREAQDEVLARLQFGLPEDETGEARPQPIANPLLRVVCHRFWQAGLELDASQALAVLVAAAVLCVVLVLALGVLLGAMVSALAAVAALLLLQQLAGRRRRRIVALLPDFLEHVLRALIAGNTLEEAFAEAARDCPEPLRALFMGVSRQVRLGAPIEDALTQVADVHDLPDVRVLAMTARVNRRYGGSIRNMIKSLIQVIRVRGTAAQKLRSLTMETRISAISLFIIPLGISAYIVLSNPAFYNDILSYSLGRIVMVGTFFWQLIGGLVMWRMIRATEGSA